MVYCGMVVLFFLAKRAGKNASDGALKQSLAEGHDLGSVNHA